MLPPELLAELVAYTDAHGLRNLRASSKLFCGVFTRYSFGTFLVKDQVPVIQSRCSQLGNDYRSILPYMRRCKVRCGYAADEDANGSEAARAVYELLDGLRDFPAIVSVDMVLCTAGKQAWKARQRFSEQLGAVIDHLPSAPNLRLHLREDRVDFPSLTLLTCTAAVDGTRELLVVRERESFFDGSTWLLAYRPIFTSLVLEGAVLDQTSLALMCGMYNLISICMQDTYIASSAHEAPHAGLLTWGELWRIVESEWSDLREANVESKGRYVYPVHTKYVAYEVRAVHPEVTEDDEKAFELFQNVLELRRRGTPRSSLQKDRSFV